ncbi:MAG: polysaccharide lyase family 1 protein [Bacteroidales bacterium]
MYKRIIQAAAIILPLNLFSQPIAFPGADGFGKYASGGRGGKVIEVTNLNDKGKGSFRAALAEKGKRTIIFKVSGTIFLDSRLDIKNGDLTIAGQTAPGDGITIANYPIDINSENVIVRFIRCRLGDLKKTQDDAFTVTRSKNIIVDHCSFSWSEDETASCYRNKDFTMQWCIISESLNKSAHVKGDHGYGGIWGGDKASFHHNLLAHHTSRNPRFNGARFEANWNEMVDFRNNVIYNWGFNSSYGGDPSDKDGAKAKINMVNNYYKPGPGTKNNKIKYRILEPFSMKDDGYSFWYIDGNYMDGKPEVTKDNWDLGVQGVDNSEKVKMKVDVPFDFIMEKTDSATTAYLQVLQNVGCTKPTMDVVDLRIINEVKTGTATYGDTWGEKSGIIDSQNDVGGWPTLKSGIAPTDTDHDGMPDDWEIRNNLNPKDPSDNSNYTLSKEYTNLEVYINSLVE